jgi:tetratricopeptide (TPR) repeat protein
VENHQQVTEALHAALNVDQGKGGSVIAICGESGVGKTHFVREFLEQMGDSVFLFQMNGLATDQAPLSSIYKTLYSAVSSVEIAKQSFIYLIRKYSSMLPGFGKFIAPLTKDIHREAFGQVVARSGIKFDTSLSPNIIRFVKEMASGQRVLWVCDDIQWMDTESWEALVAICDSARENDWIIVLLYNQRVESWCDTRTRIGRVFENWERHADDIGWTRFDAKRWSEKTLPDLCYKLLDAQCEFTSQQIGTLYSLTSGIPLYVKSALQVLRETDNIKNIDGRWQAIGTWEDMDIHADLRTSISQRLKRIYQALPQSRASLEVASVIGQTFQENIIDAVLNTEDAFRVFCQVESQFRIVEYLIEQRHWSFDHNVTREIIYSTLGKQAGKLHLTIAKYLTDATELEVSPLIIAYHYEQGGDFGAACEIKIGEVERLLESALFESALRLLESTLHVVEKVSYDLTIERREYIKILWGRLLFHTARYNEAMDHFEPLCTSSKNRERQANAQHWMGKTLIKLASPHDFELGIVQLSRAKEYYNATGDFQALGDVLTDLVVAYAHINCFTEAEELFAEAEKSYTRANDNLGMARLQRRNVIFMESELSAPILEKVSHTFESLGVVHEMVMSLNNAATEYIYLDQCRKARELLEKAINGSLDIGGFRSAYMYNNLALIDIIESQFDAAEEKLYQAKENTSRTVVNLVLDNNEAVVQLEKFGPEHAQHAFRRILEIAKVVGENAYIIPVIINRAACLMELERYEDAINQLLEITPKKENSYSAYKYRRWYGLLRKLYSHTGEHEKNSRLEQNYQWCENTPDNRYYNYPYALIDMQFWSD